MRPAPMRPANMRRIDLQIVWWRRRAPAPARPAASGRTETPERRRRTRVRLTRSSPAQLRGRMHSGPVSYHRAAQGSTLVGGATAQPRRCSRGAAWWDGPRPALPRGPSTIRRIDVHVVTVVQPRCPPFPATRALAETVMPEWQCCLPGATVTGLKTDSTVSMDGGSWPCGEPVRAHPRQTFRS